MKIYFNNTLIQGQEMTKYQTKNKPMIDIPKGMFLIMFDPDAPPVTNGKAWIHWIVDSEGNEYLPYYPPTPPVGTGTYHYIFRLLQEKPPIPSKRNQQIVPVGTEEIFFTVRSQQGGAKKRKTKRKTKVVKAYKTV